MNLAVLAEQQRLAAAGFDPGPLDGIEGPRTRAARAAELASHDSHAAHFVPDARSAQNIALLLPRVQTLATEFLRRLSTAGIHAKVISGLRTWAEQDALYAQGRTTDSRRVTNVRGGYSNHNYGLAFDIGIWSDEGKYLDDSPLYRDAAPIGKALGLFWGGDWKSPVDEPHYELRPTWANGMTEGAMIAELRARKLQGKDLLA